MPTFIVEIDKLVLSADRTVPIDPPMRVEVDAADEADARAQVWAKFARAKVTDSAVDGGGSVEAMQARTHAVVSWPSKRHTLDRVDVNGNYEPGNCKWSTWEEQAVNRRPWGINRRAA